MKMKTINKLSLLMMLTLTLVSCGNKNKDQEATPTLDDVNLPTEPKEESTNPGSAYLPVEGSEATNPLEITANYDYFDNNLLHNISGQWSGYGIHTPSILKYAGVYYLYQSTPKTNVGIRAFKSTDLINWDYVTESGFTSGYISKDRLTYAATSPRVYFYNDLFYLFFNTPNGYKVYSSSSPEGQFNYVKDLNYASKYNASIYMAPNGKLFFVTGGEKSVALYEMKSIDEIDESTRVEVDCTTIDSYSGASFETQSPSIFNIDGVTYLTYSSVDESFNSYRSYLVSAINPDYSSSQTFAQSFFNQQQGPILINTNSMHGDIALGDLSIIEGPDMVSYYAMYTSLESPGVRRLNFAPISYSGANISFAHRNLQEVKDVKEIITPVLTNEEKALTEETIKNTYTATLVADKVDEYYFSYKTANNNYSLSFADGKAILSKKENGLASEIGRYDAMGDKHIVKVIANEKILNVELDGKAIVSNYQSSSDLSGKLGYKVSEESQIIHTTYVETTPLINERYFFKQGESNLYANTYLEEFSHLTSSEPLKQVSETYSDFYGSYYLDMSSFNDYARFLVDVPEDGRYGVEMTFNASFSKFNSSIGVRLGSGDELIYEIPRLGEQGYARVLTAEFDVTKGAKELFLENLSKAQLRLIALRLVKVSGFVPDYSNTLESYATKGIHYETDFALNDSYHSHEVYEGAKMFAYVGDNTITDFKMEIEIGFLYSQSISGYVGVAFRCNNFASSSKDGDDSLIGYYLEISQYQIRLKKYQYGYNITLGIKDLANSIGDVLPYTITMVGNTITIYREDYRVFSITDQFAFSSGHLGFGSRDTNGVIRNLVVSKGGE